MGESTEVKDDSVRFPGTAGIPVRWRVHAPNGSRDNAQEPAPAIRSPFSQDR